MSQFQREKYDPMITTLGFMKWNQFYLSKKNEAINKVWPQWIESVKSQNNESSEMFIKLHEECQVGIMSEALAETVGSIMNAHCGGGRYLNPANFNVEICLRFNLGPLHVLQELAREIVDSRGKEYYRKYGPKNLQLSKTMSATIFNYRNNEEAEAHLPLDIWK